MRLEAAKFEKTRTEAERERASGRLEQVRAMKAQLADNLKFLGSNGARIVLLLEFKAARRNLHALEAEEARLARSLAYHERVMTRLDREVENIQREIDSAPGKVIRFRKKDEEA